MAKKLLKSHLKNSIKIDVEQSMFLMENVKPDAQIHLIERSLQGPKIKLLL